MKTDNVALVLSLAILLVGLALVILDQPSSPQQWSQYALSFGFTPEGARAYGYACQSASERGEEIPTVESWASHNPFDIDMASHAGVGTCQCIARGAMQDNPASAGYLNEGKW
ncbi:MAG: hypothetical protein BWY43_00276 [candidate division WS2 bacterium ADurb.Bin280]|uniref:Uncharacterized protein n=1 Tax=candidate division WS2 bacterium ADurb.Bin280 TaxID=1852829 RepID=A0A1V5SER1_9BACT|nr:MAG: hypothetical protein BWY43_00276 [candidate division WS2 bacterium ADurb.Bin280]